MERRRWVGLGCERGEAVSESGAGERRSAALGSERGEAAGEPSSSSRASPPLAERSGEGRSWKRGALLARHLCKWHGTSRREGKKREEVFEKLSLS